MHENRFPEHLLKALKEREKNGLLRTLKLNSPAIDFCSNDYLGFSKLGLLKRLENQQGMTRLNPPSGGSLATGNKEQRSSSSAQLASNSEQMFGSTGSRLITGNSELIEEAEKQIALFHHSESALIFNSGYDANVGLFSSVPQKNDLVLFDEYIHASIYDGIRLSHATHYKFKHNDLNSLSDLVNRHKANHANIFIAVESVYSMDGDTAPLREIAELYKTNNNIFLIVDEAHAIGVFGKQGRGLCSALNLEKKCFARVYTYGKAMGCHGAAVAGSEMLRKYLLNFSRPFIYTTALPAHSIEAVLNAYKLLIETNQQEILRENISYFFTKASSLNNLIKSQSAIQSLLVDNLKRAEELEKLLAANNIHAKAIKSPTVKAGFERIRICLHAYNSREEIDTLINILKSF